MTLPLPMYDEARTDELGPRLVLEEHLHTAQNDLRDEVVYVPTRAVIVQGVGASIELGPLLLADLADPQTQGVL